jgi:diketogulonate reductase-like aldo/keto reductase
MMSSVQTEYTLANGITIPSIGFGTWQTPSGDVAVQAVKAAIAAGYRHIDTAQMYDNEASVGQGLRESGVARAEIFLTTKLRNRAHGYEKTRAAIAESLAELGLEYIDLFLVHWPNPISNRNDWQEANAGTWRAMEECYNEGKIKALGISNFRQHHIEALEKTANIAPHVNQIRLCPGETQDELVDFCRARGMVLEAYSPLGVGKIFDVPEMQELAQKYRKSVAQICVRWSLQRGYLPLPKSVTPARITENLDVFGFSLQDDDVQRIAELKGCVGYSHDPDTVGF